MHGDPPDEFDAHLDDGSDDDGPIRGWVPPDDRLWLHPSERAAASASARSAPCPAPDRPPAGRWMAGGMAACVVLTMVVVVMVLTTTEGTRNAEAPQPTWGSGTPTTEAGGHDQLADVRWMTQVAASARDSIVALLVERSSGTSMGTGVVAEAGGIVVTLQPVVANARTVTVIEADGTRQAAARVGSDATTGITVYRIADGLPPAVFADRDPATGSMVAALAMEPRTPSRLVPTPRLYGGNVLFAGIATGTWQGTGFCATGVAVPMPAGDLGSPLVDRSGAVSGILDAVVGSGNQQTSVFLPAELVRDVVDQIVRHGSVEHGTAGLDLTNASGPDGYGGGAEVEAVTSGGAAALAGLQAGDVVVDVDGRPVRSVAELSTRLYGEPPGAQLRFGVKRSGATVHLMVVLA